MTATLPTVRGLRLDSLTGVRFIAAFLVFGFHAPTGDLFSAGMVGVSLFYILSGFVMAWTAREGDTTGQFYRRRFARIYPAYIAAWLLALSWLMAAGNATILDVILPPTLLQSWIPSREAYFAGSAVFWSLSCEIFFYVVFPFLHRWLVKLRTSRVVAVAVGAGTVSILFAVAMIPFGDLPLVRYLVIVFPPVRLLEFVIGVCVGIAFRRGFRLRFPLWGALLIALAGVVVASFAPYTVSRYAVTLIPFVLLVVCLASTDLTGGWSFLRWRPVVALGVWSYCFYLTHTTVIAVLFAFGDGLGVIGGSQVAWVAFTGVSLVVSIVLAWLLHIWVERPMERRLRPTGRPRLDTD